jgi:hypothetical protein
MIIFKLAFATFQILFGCFVVNSSKLNSAIFSWDNEAQNKGNPIATSADISQSHRQELQLLPVGVTDCDDYFGRTTLLSDEEIIILLYEPNKNYFCVNGGFCKTTYKTHPEDPCVCVEGTCM